MKIVFFNGGDSISGGAVVLMLQIDRFGGGRAGTLIGNAESHVGLGKMLP